MRKVNIITGIILWTLLTETHQSAGGDLHQTLNRTGTSPNPSIYLYLCICNKVCDKLITIFPTRCQTFCGSDDFNKVFYFIFQLASELSFCCIFFPTKHFNLDPQMYENFKYVLLQINLSDSKSHFYKIFFTPKQVISL